MSNIVMLCALLRYSIFQFLNFDVFVVMDLTIYHLLRYNVMHKASSHKLNHILCKTITYLVVNIMIFSNSMESICKSFQFTLQEQTKSK